MPRKDVKVFTKDVDALPEERRLQMCEKVVQIFPGFDTQHLKNTQIGTSKIYSMVSSNSMFLQLLVCPTNPSIFIHVAEDYEIDDYYNMFVVVENHEIDPRPPLNILNYDIVLAASVGVYDTTTVKIRKVTDEESIKEYVGDVVDDSFEIKHLAEVLRIGEDSMGETYMRLAIIDVDKLSQDERYKMCETAIKLIAGEKVKFLNNPITASQFYTIEPTNTVYLGPNVIQAFQCPTDPLTYLHVALLRDNEYGVFVIVQGEPDFLESVIPALK